MLRKTRSDRFQGARHDHDRRLGSEELCRDRVQLLPQLVNVRILGCQFLTPVDSLRHFSAAEGGMSDDLERLFRDVLPTLSLAERQALRIIIKSFGRRGSETHLVPERPGPLPIRSSAVAYRRVLDCVSDDELLRVAEIRHGLSQEEPVGLPAEDELQAPRPPLICAPPRRRPADAQLRQNP